MTSLTPGQVQIIKATVPVLAQHGETITTKFYADMLEAHPELRNVFNTTHQATGHQPRALTGSLQAYASNIDDLGKLSPVVELICHKHASLYIPPEHYYIVGEHLLKTMRTVLGDAATQDILGAWEAAYWQLANIMISKEDDMYKEADGWTSWKDFKIVRKEREAKEITSFYLQPVDANLKLPVFKPGQFISVNIFVNELDGGVWQARQYSLSDVPGKDYLRISVKRELGIEVGEPRHFTHPGYLSNIMHEKKNVGDIVQVSHPWGDFYFDEEKEDRDAPIVLISAGVGLTCLNSILNTTLEHSTSRPVTWIHGARDSKTRAFKKEIDELAAKKRNLHTVYFSSSPKEGEVQGLDYDIKGRVNLGNVDKKVLFTNNEKTLYFTCGPAQFMLDVEAKLKIYGVPAERIHMELFGTGGIPAGVDL
ncbi:flavohemo protein [Didymella exigua CBS 183.55]|uniref:nitric oxide dioxygenase n=1 Tax=Didymella exigua CBS 183.55 TaxID=1150837 RepID=A0A6A5R4U7_9PLEO|nr:flavohemo protein [Didymella exigua CBS 183.55]KAF1923135.1 flavohemo protein [Didymella exigua CBS 183.55]